MAHFGSVLVEYHLRVVREREQSASWGPALNVRQEPDPDGVPVHERGCVRHLRRAPIASSRHLPDPHFYFVQRRGLKSARTPEKIQQEFSFPSPNRSFGFACNGRSSQFLSDWLNNEMVADECPVAPFNASTSRSYCKLIFGGLINTAFPEISISDTIHFLGMRLR